MSEARYILSVTIFTINNDITAIKSSDEHITKPFLHAGTKICLQVKLNDWLNIFV